ncbi:Pycsar system effector family protein [Brevundimonas sp.]|uniref:Pycsar system effector family protein n=1 Tax=Brevundimonas sp. TaxID=1871086 RepID=UPI003F708C17
MTATPDPKISDAEITSSALAQLDRLQAFFGRVEGKASFLLGINLALLGSVAVATPLATLWSPANICGLIAAALLGFSTVNLYAAFYPHLANPQTSALYFADIANLTADDYRARVRDASPEDRANDALCQVWRNAQILEKKFRRSRSAFLLTAAGVPFWLALLALSVARSGALPIA